MWYDNNVISCYPNTGVAVGELLFAREQLLRLSGAGIDLERLSISRLRLDIPTFRSRLRLEASGVRFEVRQQRLPEVERLDGYRIICVTTVCFVIIMCIYHTDIIVICAVLIFV